MNNLTIHPLTPERWNDFETLFGKKGAYAGCWCMWWRLKRSEFEKQQGEGNRLAMKAIVDSGEIPGIIAYLGDKPIGWCSVALREDFASLNRSRVLKPIDNSAVWSIVCFFVHKDYRNKGVSLSLINGAVNYAKNRGAKIVEAYPTVPKSAKLPPVSSFMGIPALFEKAGFEECARPSPSKVVMRYYLTR